ncbi:hypothetical protein Hdeb2414_s0006g00189851 [Helianthus debilis subsp. tardiflorus]
MSGDLFPFKIQTPNLKISFQISNPSSSPSLFLSLKDSNLDHPSRFMLFRYSPYSPSGSSLTVHVVHGSCCSDSDLDLPFQNSCCFVVELSHIRHLGFLRFMLFR